jgi:acyl-CoA reductase-like NAD-dependent aldehyde dehydrogenase
MAQLITAEMGAPITFAQMAQVGLTSMMVKGLLDVATHHPWQEERNGAFGRFILRKEPVGVVVAIVPWNMPQFLIATKVIPALLAGCTVVLKPSPETPLDALEVADLFEQVGLPPGVLNVLPGGRETGEQLVAHPGVDKITFTGSTAAGRRVALAGASGLKKVSLELGGKSAAIALDDSDPAEVAAGVRLSSLGNSGQVCNGLFRILVPAARADEYIDAMAAATDSLKVGDPSDPTTEVGPLVARRQQERVRGYIEAGKAEGARLVVGGAEMPEGIDHGWFIRPTVFAEVDNSMTIAREEIFGPVISMITYRDEAEALRIANDSDYGLAGAVWTNDIDHGIEVAAQVRTGTFGVNQGYMQDPTVPFGGVKASGIGRELGPEGLEAFLDIKSIAIAPTA